MFKAAHTMDNLIVTRLSTG